MAKIVIVDTGVANRHSMHNALRYVGADVIVTNDRQEIEKADKLVIPGVGAFSAGMRAINEQGFRAVLERQVHDLEKPTLGVCLGMQLMADSSEEDGHHKGLGWISGKVERLSPDDPQLKVPHVGFSATNYRVGCPLFSGLPQGVDFYYVHSYRFICKQESVVATCEHGGEFTSAISKNNLFAVQFHPEKSQTAGLRLLENFIKNI